MTLNNNIGYKLNTSHFSYSDLAPVFAITLLARIFNSDEMLIGLALRVEHQVVISSLEVFVILAARAGFDAHTLPADDGNGQKDTKANDNLGVLVRVGFGISCGLNGLLGGCLCGSERSVVHFPHDLFCHFFSGHCLVELAVP